MKQITDVTDEEVVNKLNIYSSCVAKSLNISNYEDYNSLPENIDHPTLMASFKWKNH